jgi:radical SAM-linked protein
VDSSRTNTSRPPVTNAVDRLRLRFRKSSDRRFLSHHDLLRCFERLLRRSKLPFHCTQGFHPHPRLVFALSLPLGVIGCEEVAELELDKVLPVEEVLERLRKDTPPGIEILSISRVSLKSSPQVRALCYRLPVPAGRVDATLAKIAEVLAASELWLGRSKPRPGEVPLTAHERDAEESQDGPRVNVRPFLRDLRLTQQGEGFALEIELWLTPAGTAKPFEVLSLLGLTDLLDAGVVLERAWLEMHDENESGERG